MMYLITFGYDTAEFSTAAEVRQFVAELEEDDESFEVWKIDYTYMDEQFDADE